MKIVTFLYLCVFMLGIIMLPVNEGDTTSLSIFLCLASVGIVGLPHGAIDHILFIKTTSLPKWKFYGVYLALMIVYILMWMVFPTLSLVVFLLISAYHFGESQLTNCQQKSWVTYISYGVWGVHLLSTYITYQYDAIIELCNGQADMETFVSLFTWIASDGIFLASSGILIGALLIYQTYRSSLTMQQLLQEVYVLGLIHTSFFLFDPMISFTLYFVILHSLKVMMDEFTFLKSQISSITLPAFVKLFVPFTVISIVGLGLILLLNDVFLGQSIVYLMILMTSVITLPHAILMHHFYNSQSDVAL